MLNKFTNKVFQLAFRIFYTRFEIGKAFAKHTRKQAYQRYRSEILNYLVNNGIVPNRNDTNINIL